MLAASCKFFRDLFKVLGAAARYELTNVEPTAVGHIPKVCIFQCKQIEQTLGSTEG